MVLKKIELLDLESIRYTTWKKAFDLTHTIDVHDTPFVALCLELDSPLWTGDKKLANGLKSKQVDWIMNTEMIQKIR